MLIKLFPESNVPLYTQLIDEIKLGIAKKDLLPGESLPSVRAMAGDLGINMHTVNKAYQRLKEEGLLIIHRQKGVMVSLNMPPADEAYFGLLEENLTRLIADAMIHEIDKNTAIELTERIYNKIKGKEENEWDLH